MIRLGGKREMEMEIGFPGGQKVETRFKGGSIVVGSDSENESALEPLDLFFVSLGLCVGKYVLEFCRPRNIPHEGARVVLQTEWCEKKKMHTKVMIDITLPREVPAKYKKAVMRTVGLCSVKKHILNPPAFEVDARIAS